jgi:hypothetical protein
MKTRAELLAQLEAEQAAGDPTWRETDSAIDDAERDVAIRRLIALLDRTLKRELLQWLPEAALTIPSFSKQVGERARPEQGSLFEDPVTAHRERRAAMGLRAIK